jgi:hypothetical protein
MALRLTKTRKRKVSRAARRRPAAGELKKKQTQAPERDVAGTRTLRDRDVVALTKSIRERVADAERSDAEARVAIGGMLRELREQIRHGEWERWLESDVPFTPRSAWSYMQLHDWAQRHPVNFQQLAPLGPTKLYLLIRLKPEKLAALLKRKRHLVPMTGKLRSLAGMTVAELMSVLGGLSGGEKPGPADRAFTSYRRSVKAVVAAMDELTRYRQGVDLGEVKAVHATLLSAAAALAVAFGLPAA